MTLKYGDMALTVEFVTPAIARRWLQQNEGNRTMRPAKVMQYARDQAAGEWHRKPVAVCFDQSGKLGNGQHTLAAIVRSECGQELLIARNVPRKAIALMDMGVARTVSDVAAFIGQSMESRKAAIARVVLHGPSDNEARSFNELLEAYQAHKEVIDFVADQSPRVAGFSATVLAVLARAAYTQDREKITRFITVVKNGVPDGDHESGAVRLRDFARSLRGGGGSVSVRPELYAKTQAALSAFLAGKPISKVYGITSEVFPVPTA